MKDPTRMLHAGRRMLLWLLVAICLIAAATAIVGISYVQSIAGWRWPLTIALLFAAWESIGAALDAFFYRMTRRKLRAFARDIRNY